MTNELSLDDFLGHTSTNRDKGKRTLNWRKRQPSQVTTWLHPGSSIIALWGHNWPRIVEIERDGEKVTEVWGGRFNCWESEDVLRNQYQRTQDGSRKRPPQVCPLCLLIEYIRTEVTVGGLSWTTPIFRFVGGDEDAAEVWTAGGIYNAFSGDLSRQEIAELKRAGIRRDEAWKQNAMAKCSYLFVIVDKDEADKGPQVAIETTALGDAVKRVIRDQIESIGAQKGNPLKTPYAIRWKYVEDAKEFSQKYQALALPLEQMSAEVSSALASPAPDVSGHIAKGNVASLRAMMERSALVDLPFDRIFAEAERREGVGDAPKAPAKAPPPRVEQSAPKAVSPSPPPVVSGGGSRRRSSVSVEPTEPVYPPGTVTIPCDNCGAVMAETDEKCWKCGTTYEIDVTPPPAKKKAPVAGGQWPGEGEEGEVGF